MRVDSGRARWLATAACMWAALHTAHAAPNYAKSSTSVSVDESAQKERLDGGGIVVRVQRTDDLFSDATAHEAARLLLEKKTHIAFRIQVDNQAGTLNVNDVQLDMFDGPESKTAHAQPVRAAAVKAEAYTLPRSHDRPTITSSELSALLEQMSPGIVGIEVKLEVASLGEVALPQSQSQDLSSPSPEHGDSLIGIKPSSLSVRQVVVWVRVTEVEGKLLPPRSTTTFHPILQLVVSSANGKVVKTETVSVDGKANLGDAHALSLGPVMHHDMPALLPPVQRWRKMDGQSNSPVSSSSGFFAWLKSFFVSTGQGAAVSRRRYGGCHGRGRARGRWFGGGRNGRGGDARLDHGQDGDSIGVFDEASMQHVKHRLSSHRPAVENPFSGLMEGGDEGSPDWRASRHHAHHHDMHDADSLDGSEGDEDMHRLWHHRFRGQRHGEHMHMHHGVGGFTVYNRMHRFFRRMAIGFIYGMTLVGTVLVHPVTVLVNALLLVMFHVFRRAAERRRAQIRLADDEVAFSAMEKLEEKEALLDGAAACDNKEKA